MNKNIEILRNLSTSCKPVTMNCSVKEVRKLWRKVSTVRDRKYLKLCVERLSDESCVVYLEERENSDPIDPIGCGLLILCSMLISGGLILWAI